MPDVNTLTDDEFLQLLGDEAMWVYRDMKKNHNIQLTPDNRTFLLQLNTICTEAEHGD